jgi:hypothetical protein
MEEALGGLLNAPAAYPEWRSDPLLVWDQRYMAAFLSFVVGHGTIVAAAK